MSINAKFILTNTRTHICFTCFQQSSQIFRQFIDWLTKEIEHEIVVRHMRNKHQLNLLWSHIIFCFLFHFYSIFVDILNLIIIGGAHGVWMMCDWVLEWLMERLQIVMQICIAARRLASVTITCLMMIANKLKLMKKYAVSTKKNRRIHGKQGRLTYFTVQLNIIFEY